MHIHLHGSARACAHTLTHTHTFRHTCTHMCAHVCVHSSDLLHAFFFSCPQSDKQISATSGLTFGDLRQSMGSVAFEMAARKSCILCSFELVIFCSHVMSFVSFDERYDKASLLVCFCGVFCKICFCLFVFLFLVLF